MDWDKAKPLLDAKLDPSHIRKPTGRFGPKGDYLEGWHVINEANRVFGYGGWSYKIDLSRDDLREVSKDGRTQWQAAYTCICTVTVDGVTRQDVGFGSGFASMIGDAIEGATKEAATDALKRALRTFGNIFGLALYDKARENVAKPEPESPKAETQSDPGGKISQVALGHALSRIGAAMTMDNLKAAWNGLSDDVRADDDVLAAKEMRKAELNAEAAHGVGK